MDSQPDLSTALGTLLSDSDLMSRIAGIVNGTASQDSSKEPDAAPVSAQTSDVKPPPGNATSLNLGSLLSDPAIMEKLPSVMATIAPILNGGGDKKQDEKKDHGRPCDRRIALLCALKPYLSPRRCEAIDYIIKLDRIGSLLSNLN